MITSKTGTSRIVWASSPWEQLYKPLQRKRPTLPLKNKFNQSLPDSTTDSNSSNSRLQSLSLNHSIFLFNHFSPLSCLNLIFILRFFSAISPQFNSDILFFLQYWYNHYPANHHILDSSASIFHSPAQTLLNSINYYQSNFVVLLGKQNWINKHEHIP